MSLMKKFYVDRYLHIRSFALQFAFSTTAAVIVYNLGLHDYGALNFEAWQLVYIPLAIYLGGLSAVFIHNATHNSFKPRWLNWWAGQLSGFHQLWGFTGWKLIHLIHHHYSDDVNMDPHPPKGRTFWQFARTMFLESSLKVSERYREHWGTSGGTKLLQGMGSTVLFSMACANLALIYLLLGNEAFLLFYIPSYIVNHLLFVDINFTAHPADENGQTAAANLNHNWYYKLANFMWCGIYFHGNHHRKPTLFNPRYMATNKARASRAAIEPSPVLAEEVA